MTKQEAITLIAAMRAAVSQVPSYCEQQAREFASTPIRESDLLPHIEDDIVVNAIRGRKIIPIRWNDLSPEERRAASHNLDNPCDVA